MWYHKREQSNKKAVKTSKTSVRKRSQPAKAARSTKTRRQRPLHKRVLLHPFSIMVLLCTGVILAGSTYRSIAASYDVTATVPAELPSAPALIQQPYDQQHFSGTPITVRGSCPAASYVKLYRNTVFSGVATCSGQTFQIQTGLTAGANQLQAKVYNFTNQEGPASSPIVVHYDETTVTPALPPATPTTLWVDNVEQSDFEQGVVRNTSDIPTVSGFAPPYADIVVTFHSVVTTCKTQADGQGWWTCTPDHPLALGMHWVNIEATTVDGVHMTMPGFQINVLESLSNLRKTPRSAPPLLIISEYQFQTHYVGQPFTWSLGVNGGVPPYTLVIDWGDGSQTTMLRHSGVSFTLTHAYPEAKTYPVFVKSTDRQGATAVLQLNAVVKGQAIGVASLTTKGPLASLFTSVQHYLWIVWPVYIAVVLMAISYWLGEREVYQRFRGRRLARSSKGRSL